MSLKVTVGTSNAINTSIVSKRTSTKIETLADVDVEGIQDGYTLVYNTATNFTAAVSLPEDGEVTISLTAVQTSAIKAGRYVYDIEITGDGETLRVLEGIVVINPEVTK